MVLDVSIPPSCLRVDVADRANYRLEDPPAGTSGRPGAGWLGEGCVCVSLGDDWTTPAHLIVSCDPDDQSPGQGLLPGRVTFESGTLFLEEIVAGSRMTDTRIPPGSYQVELAADLRTRTFRVRMFDHWDK